MNVIYCKVRQITLQIVTLQCQRILPRSHCPEVDTRLPYEFHVNFAPNFRNGQSTAEAITMHREGHMIAIVSQHEGNTEM